MKRAGHLLLVLALVVPVRSMLAQGRATGADLAGVVTDQSSAVLVGARVTVTNLATNIERAIATDRAGRFSIPLLPPGSYGVKVEADGFATETTTVTLTLGAVIELNVTLPLATLTAAATVIGASPVVELQKTAVANVLTRQQIEQLPIDVRNFISFAVITPGVTIDQTPQQGASATSGLTFAGQRARSNNITIDGVDNNDVAAGGVRATFSQEAVQEFQVLTNSYTAEFGNASGGVVNIVTKSGTNAVGGNAFFFYRDKALNAKGHFEKLDPFGSRLDLRKAPYGQKQFGATLGGPIRKDRSFFFASYERLDIRGSNLVTIDDRTAVRHPFLGTPLGTPAQILRTAGFPIETGNIAYDHTTNQLLAKLDHHLRSDKTLTVRFNGADKLNENVEPFGGVTARSRAAALEATDYGLAVSQNSVVSSRWLNELRFQAAYRGQLVRSLDPVCGGPCVRSDQGGPTLEVAGVASVGRQRFTPQNRKGMSYQLVNTTSLYSGTHLMKAGVDVTLRDDMVREPVLPLHFGGRYIFAPLPAVPGLLPAPVSSIQAVALGLPAAYVQGYGRNTDQFDSGDLALFWQDDWRWGSRVTLRYGARYQYQFWEDVLYSTRGYPGAYGFPADRNNIAPRIAVAWDPAGDKKTSIHAAYGVFYDSQIRAIQAVPQLIDGDTHVRTLVAQFPSPLVLAAWNSPGHRLPESAAGTFASLQFAVDPGLKTPYAHHASLGVDRELPGALGLSASLVYARGTNQAGTIDYNPLVPALGSGRRPLDVNGIAGTSASVLQYTSFGETWYKGLVLALNKRYGQGYQFLASYTLSKAEDTSTDFATAFIAQQNGRGRDPENLKGLPIGFDPRSERGPSTQDQRHRFVFSGIASVRGGLVVSTIVTLASGRPYTILAGFDLNRDGDGGAFPPDRARRDPALESSSLGRNSETMPGQAVIDVRVSRRFRVGNRPSVEAILEVFNLFNRTNYVETTNVSSAFIFGTGAYPDEPLPSFGRFTQAGPPLQMQLGLKVSF